MSKNKITILIISLAYLALTLYLFLTQAGIGVMLLFAIFSYIFYTPLIAIFKYDIDEIENNNITLYIQRVVYVLFGVLILYVSGLFSAETFISIMKFTLSNLPKFEPPSLMPFIKGLSLLNLLVFVFVVFILRVYILYLLGAALALWLLYFLFHLLLGFLIIFVYLLSSILLLGGLIYIAYRGRKITELYVKNNFQRAAIFFSTITSAIYLIIVFYINLFTLGS